MGLVHWLMGDYGHISWRNIYHTVLVQINWKALDSFCFRNSILGSPWGYTFMKYQPINNGAPKDTWRKLHTLCRFACIVFISVQCAHSESTNNKSVYSKNRWTQGWPSLAVIITMQAIYISMSNSVAALLREPPFYFCRMVVVTDFPCESGTKY